MEAKSTESQPVTPQSQITECSVKKVLLADKGEDAQLKSWKTVDFTKRGDNYACVVTSVEVQYSLNNQNLHVSYVVKLNPCRKFTGFPDLTPLIFRKEGKFYEDMVPQLNAQLTSAGQKPLRVPRCLLVNLEEGKEQIYFEDLRVKGFKMFDRRKGMDKDHTTLVLEELARLHGASCLLRSKYPPETWETIFDYLVLDMFNSDEELREKSKPLIEGNLSQGQMMLKKIGGYEKAENFLESLKPKAMDLMSTSLKSKRFITINHGDCWNNNILFRYDDEGLPIEVILLDLQGCRVASLASDLNYFLFTSLTGSVRAPNIDAFMTAYYTAYKTVVEGGSQSMYFTQEELLEEFRDKNVSGLLFALSIIPALMMEPDQTVDVSKDVDIVKFMQEYREKTMSQLDNNPLFKPRFLALFDELINNGLIS